MKKVSCLVILEQHYDLLTIKQIFICDCKGVMKSLTPYIKQAIRPNVFDWYYDVNECVKKFLKVYDLQLRKRNGFDMIYYITDIAENFTMYGDAL